jgi:hypothetical protein
MRADPVPAGKMGDDRPVRRAQPPPWGAVPGHDSMWPTPLQTDLLRAALFADERGLAAWRRIRPLLDVAAMDYGTHALLPQLRANLIALGIDDDPLLDLFKGVQRFAWARTQVLLARVMPIVAALDEQGLQTMLLKGAAMLVEGRRHAGIRHMGDIDVLVPTGAVAEAVQVILGHGLASVEGLPAWYLSEYVPRVRASVGFGDGAEGRLDLHWYATRASCQAGADDDFWEASLPVELRGVHTRALCPADELLLTIVHGLRWGPSPGYRWVLDAALVVRDASGELDYERLAVQAGRRRVGPTVRAGLAFLQQVAGVQVPPATIRRLAAASPMLRFELRAQARQPRRRGVAGRTAVVHGEYLRRRLPLGARATPAAHARLAAERLGISRIPDLVYLRPGGRPGPARPFTEVEAPIGAGDCEPPPLGWGEPLDFGDPDTVRRHSIYGLWYPEDWGCWIAGREARLALELSDPAPSTLLLELAAGGVGWQRRSGDRLRVLLGGRRIAGLTLGTRAESTGIVLPEELVRGRTGLELVLRVPDAVSPARRRVNDDLRPFGAFLQRLSLRPIATCAAGGRVGVGLGTEDERMLVSGWGEAAPAGRWTVGPSARIALRTETSASQLEWIADPLLPPGAPPLSVEVHANGRRLGIVRCDPGNPVGRVPLKGVRAGTDLQLEWRIRDPRSPKQLGLSADERPLGLFFRDVALL